MQRIVLKKVEKYFESFQFTLVMIYHKDLSINEIHKRLSKRYKELVAYSEYGPSPGALFIRDGRTMYLLLNKDSSVGIIAHECNHIAFAAFDEADTEHTHDTDEVFCYLSQHIFEFALATVISKFGNSVKNLLVF
jgi:hypothetical protein